MPNKKSNLTGSLNETEWIPIRKKKLKEYEETKKHFDIISLSDEDLNPNSEQEEIYGPQRKTKAVIPFFTQQIKECEKSVMGGVMHQYKKNKLHIGKTDHIVENRNQAIAIGLSMAKKQCRKPNPKKSIKGKNKKTLV